MKRKLSLLIAVIMVLSLIPAMSVSAATDNKIIVSGGTVADDFAWSANPAATPFIQIIDSTKMSVYDAGSSFRVNLSNAEWDFDGMDAGAYDTTANLYKNALDRWQLDVGPGNVISEATSIINTSTGGADTLYSIEFINKSTAQVTIASYDPTDGNWGGAKDTGILLPMMVEVQGEGPVTCTITDVNSRVSSGTLTFATGASGTTIWTIDDSKTSFSNDLVVPAITVTETVPGTIETGAGKTVKLTAPNGFEWIDNTHANNATTEVANSFGGFTRWDSWQTGVLGDSGAPFHWNNAGGRGEDKQVLVFDISTLGIANTSTAVGSIEFTNLRLKRSGTSSETPVGEVKIKAEVSGGDAGTLVVGVFGKRSVTLTAKDAELPLIVNGEYPIDPFDDSIKTLEVTLKEVSENAWNTNLDCILEFKEGVKFRGVEVSGATNVAGLSKNKELYMTSPFMKGHSGSHYSTAGIKFDENKVTISGINRSGADKSMEIKLKLFVSVKPGFTGDLVLRTNEDNDAFANDLSCVVAKAIDPFSVTVDKKDINLGYMNIPVGDITIKEAKAGALKRTTAQTYLGETPDVRFFVGGYNNGWLGFKTEGKAEVTSGDLVVDSYKYSGGNLILAVKRDSSTASTIKLSGMTLDTDRTIPEGKMDLRISGTPVSNWYGNLSGADKEYAGFDVGYYSVPGYINILDAAPSKDVKYTTEVAVTVGSTVIKANDKAYTMDVAPFNDNGYVMVPTRAVSVALGIADSHVIWDPIMKTVTINDSNRNRTSQFQVGSNIIKQSGVEIRFEGPSCKVVDSRTFLPFRALGEIVLGAPVSWDQASQTAFFNQGGTTLQ